VFPSLTIQKSAKAGVANVMANALTASSFLIGTFPPWWFPILHQQTFRSFVPNIRLQ
jgi:hypothetical protein